MFYDYQNAQQRAGQAQGGQPATLSDYNQQSADFANYAEEQGRQRRAQQQAELAHLEDIASGRVSHSAGQLEEGLRQNVAQQQSMARGVRGGNQIAAMRGANQNVARAQGGLVGEQKIAGMAERQQAQRMLAQGLGQARGQDLQGVLGGRGIVNQAEAARLGENEKNKTDWGPWIGAGATALTMMSDERAKKNIKKGDEDAREFAKALSAFSYDYKDEANGKGRQLGVMAQDIERTQFGKQILIDGPDGLKRVDAAKLAGALAATTASMNERLENLEGK